MLDFKKKFKSLAVFYKIGCLKFCTISIIEGIYKAKSYFFCTVLFTVHL